MKTVCTIYLREHIRFPHANMTTYPFSSRKHDNYPFPHANMTTIRFPHSNMATGIIQIIVLSFCLTLITHNIYTRSDQQLYIYTTISLSEPCYSHNNSLRKDEERIGHRHLALHSHRMLNRTLINQDPTEAQDLEDAVRAV